MVCVCTKGRARAFATEATSFQQTVQAKYAEKLKKAADREGITVEELQVKVRERSVKRPSEAPKKKNIAPAAAASNASSPAVTKVAEKVTEKAKQPYDSSAPTLDKIVKVELLEQHDVETITKIWTDYHADKDCITAVIPSETYNMLYKRSQQYPMFILPMPRETGVEFFLVQFSFHQCHFTTLLEYKTKGSESRPFLTISHFPELAKSKDIVLMKGEISDKPRMIDAQNAQFLAFALQQFYVTGGEKKLKLVEKFHLDPEQFDYQELIDEMEKVV
ncbi:ATP synthase mitochondrial F1 complex assembly factor 1 [Apophysomyces sp. BC1015]|nr:ATP synthase mitochondrial F1 complex assembly factor 1 [Apophysomyces sp. BC1015]